MTKKESYESRVEAYLLPLMEENNFELVDVEYVKEAGTWYLRAYIDKEGGIAVDDCEVISRKLSEAIDRQKEFTGTLSAYDDKTVTLTMEDGSEAVFEKADIALIRLALDF